MVCRNFRVWLLCTGIEDGASWRYRNMVILARREALPSLAIRAFHNPEVVSPLWRVPLTRTLVPGSARVASGQEIRRPWRGVRGGLNRVL